MYGHPSIEEIRGSPQRVLEAIDAYGRTKKYLMNVGNDKGKIVADLIAERKPQVMVELGGYVGYYRDSGEISITKPMTGILTFKQVFLHFVRGCCETSGRPEVFQSGKESRVCGCDHVAGRPSGSE